MKKCLAVIVMISLSMSFAQLSVEAKEALREGKTAAARALNTYEFPNPDQDLWKLALEYGEEAERLAPKEAEPQRFLAQVYSALGWYKRAWDAWQNYEARGGTLDEDARLKYSEMSVALGYLSYEQGQLEQSLTYYQQANLLQPENDEALVWLALLHFELEQPEQALSYWQKVVERDPDNPRFVAYLERTQSQLEYGIEASNAFYKGLDFYGKGEEDEALAAFAEAVQLNPNYLDALLRAGTLSLELEQLQEAIRYWEHVVALSPDNAEAKESLELAQLQVQWGVEAVNHIQIGLMLLEQEQLAEARQAFADATTANPSYGAAWAWLGRLEATLGNDENALAAFERGVKLEPSNTDFTNAYTEVQQRLSERQARAEQEALEQEVAEQETVAQVEPQPTEVEETTSVEPVAEASSESSTSGEEARKLQDIAALDIAALQNQAESERIRTFVQPSQPRKAVAPARETSAREQERTPFTSPLVLLETTYTHLEDDTGIAAFMFFEAADHLDVNLSEGYATGTLYQRLEVIQKPSEEKVSYQFCIIGNDDITVKPTCSDTDSLSFMKAGVYETSQALASFTDYKDVDWRKGMSEFILILRDKYGNPINDESGANSDLALFYPTKVRYSAMLVPEGGTFPGWSESVVMLEPSP
jgi:tetratricopeptide (TPR) repeat protein